MNTDAHLPRINEKLARNFREQAKDARPGNAQTGEMALALLSDAWRERASDVHIQFLRNACRIRFRIDGVLYEAAQLHEHLGRMVLNQCKVLGGLDPVARFTPRDTRATAELGAVRLNLRIALAPSQFGETMAIRLLDSKRLDRSLQELGLEKGMLSQVESWLTSMTGMFLASGPTGCGKTTTIYALLREVQFSDKAIISIEDPVEYQLEGITQIAVDEFHDLNFAEAVKAVLRLDPDYLMLGEIRDKASAVSAINASLSGRALLSTTHSRDAVGVLAAFRNWGVADAEIAECLNVVTAQRLVRKLCAKCRRESKPKPGELDWFARRGLTPPAHSWEAPGCEECKGIGYYGRTGIYELWKVTDQDYQAILRHEDEHSLRRNIQQREHGNLLIDARGKVEAGITSYEELARMGGL